MQNKFGFHMCKDYSGEPCPSHAQIYLETTAENIGEFDITANTVQKMTTFDMETETVIPEYEVQ